MCVNSVYCNSDASDLIPLENPPSLPEERLGLYDLPNEVLVKICSFLKETIDRRNFCYTSHLCQRVHNTERSQNLTSVIKPFRELAEKMAERLRGLYKMSPPLQQLNDFNVRMHYESVSELFNDQIKLKKLVKDFLAKGDFSEIRFLLSGSINLSDIRQFKYEISQRVGGELIELMKENRDEEIDNLLPLLEHAKEWSDVRYGGNLIFPAVDYSCLKVVKHLLDLGLNINSNRERPLKFTPLFFAIQNNHPEMLALLLSHEEIDVNFSVEASGMPHLAANMRIHRDADTWRSFVGVTPLIFAIRSHSNMSINLLLADPRVDINKRFRSKTPFYCLIHEANSALNDLDIVGPIENNPHRNEGADQIRQRLNENIEWALRLQSDPRFIFKEVDCNDSLISHLMPLNNIGLINNLINTREFDINKKIISTDSSHRKVEDSLLSYAIRFDAIDVVRRLLQYQQTNINEVLTKSSEKIEHTPLFNALHRNHQEILDLLLNDPRIDLNTSFQNKSINLTSVPLTFAAEYGTVETLDKILRHEQVGDVNQADNQGRTALMIATLREDLPMVQRLLEEENINLNAKDSNGVTAAHMAYQLSNPKEIFNCLMRKKNTSIMKRSKIIINYYRLSAKKFIPKPIPQQDTFLADPFFDPDYLTLR